MTSQLRLDDETHVVDLDDRQAREVAAMLEAAAAALEQMPLHATNVMELVFRTRQCDLARATARALLGFLPEHPPRGDVQVGWWCWTCGDITIDGDCAWEDGDPTPVHEVVPMLAPSSLTQRDTFRVETVDTHGIT